MQLATGGELGVVLLLGRLDLDAEGDRREPVSLAADLDGLLQVCRHLGRFQVPTRFVDHDLHVAVLEIGQLPQRAVQIQVGKTTTRRGDKHAQSPSVGWQ